MSVLYRAEQKSFASGGSLTVNLEFLSPARKMSAPVIEKFLIKTSFSVTVGSAATPKARLAECFTKVLCKDAAGERCNLRGTSLYVVDQIEHGVGYADGAYLAATGTRTGDFFLEIPFTPRKARRRNDYGLNLFEFLDGGELRLDCTSSSTLGGTNEISAIGTTTIEVYAVVRDERRREAKPRMCFLEYDVTVAEYTYPVNGSLRYAIYWGGEVAWHGGTTLSAQNITSRTIDLSQIADVVLRKLMMLESHPRLGDPLGLSGTATVINEDVIGASYAIPVVWPRLDAKIGEMADMVGLHFKTDGTVTTTNLPKMIICVVTDRQNQLSARTFETSSVNQLVGLMAKYGKVKTASYGTDPDGLNGWAPNVVRRLPVTLSKH